MLNTIRAHRGVDYAAPSGTPVQAAGARPRAIPRREGRLRQCGRDRARGPVVTRYGHLSRFAKGVAPGKKVDQGEVIGYVGSTGSPPVHTCTSNT